MAAIPSETNDTTPVTVPSSVVCKTVNPNDLMRREYWLVVPLAISCVSACPAKSQVFGSLIASMNLWRSGHSIRAVEAIVVLLTVLF